MYLTAFVHISTHSILKGGGMKRPFLEGKQLWGEALPITLIETVGKGLV